MGTNENTLVFFQDLCIINKCFLEWKCNMSVGTDILLS